MRSIGWVKAAYPDVDEFWDEGKAVSTYPDVDGFWNEGKTTQQSLFIHWSHGTVVIVPDFGDKQHVRVFWIGDDTVG